jgi:hypothetical protein
VKLGHRFLVRSAVIAIGRRLLVTSAIIASGAAAVVLLTSLSIGSEGPLSAGLDRLATSVAELEHRIREYVSGPGRSADLKWFDRYRSDPALLGRPDVVLLGAFDGGTPRTFDGIVRLERTIETTLPLIQIYGAWGDKPDEQFPLRLVTAIWDLGSVPVITWEPWLTDFEEAGHPHLPLRDQREKHGLARVGSGDYDFYVDSWAAAAATFGKPIFIRFAHEMNDPYRYPWGPQNNTKEEYIAAWRHVVDRFRRAGARNVIWVWSPHVAHRFWELYYPGGSHVNWVATGVLNFGPIAGWSQWWTFQEIFGDKYSQLAALGKPVMIAEFGSLAVGGDRAAWYRAALMGLPERYPAVRAVLFFETKNDQTVTYQKVDWTISNDSAVARGVADAIRAWAPVRSGLPR